MTERPQNLRGATVEFPHPYTEKLIRGVVITRTRGTRWLIESPRLSHHFERGGGERRIILHRAEFEVLHGEA